MTDPVTSQHPAPDRDQLPGWVAATLLFAGPAAWFVQLCAGVALINTHCFPATERLTADDAGQDWTEATAIVLLVLATLIASVVTFAAWRKLRVVHEETQGDHEDLLEIGHGRTRFLASWALYLGVGSIVATMVTLAGFALVPRCLG